MPAPARVKRGPPHDGATRPSWGAPREDSCASDGSAGATVASSIVRAPVALSGDARLSSQAARARLSFSATVEVRIPLVGGKMEKFIGNQLLNLLSTEQEFTTERIRESR